MNGAESLVSAALFSGVDVCFTNFGTSELNLVLALDSKPGIRPIATLYEGVCTGAADGYGRMLDKPAMSLLHLGLGLANGVSNLHNARRAGTPMFTVVGELATWHRQHDSIEATDIFGVAIPVSSWVRTSWSSQTVAQDTIDALEAAIEGQGAVLIVPQDCQWNECEPSVLTRPVFRFDPPESSLVEEAAKMLVNGSPSLVLLGGRALRERGLKAAAVIREATGCEIMAESFISRMERGPGLPFLERVPYFPEQATARLSRFEQVIMAGAKDPVATFGYKNGHSRFLGDNHRILKLAVERQDVESALEALADVLRGTGKNKNGVQAKPAPICPNASSFTGRLTPESACSVLANLQPEGAIIVEEAVTSGGAYYAASMNSPAHTLLSVTGGSIGQGIPCAVGAALACPDRPVINLQADGSAMYSLQGLWTQAREGLNVTTLICSNRSYEILRLEMKRGSHFPMGECSRTLTSLEYPSLEWARLSSGMGVPGVCVTTVEDLAVELKKAIEEPGPHLIEMIL